MITIGQGLAPSRRRDGGDGHAAGTLSRRPAAQVLLPPFLSLPYVARCSNRSLHISRSRARPPGTPVRRGAELRVNGSPWGASEWLDGLVIKPAPCCPVRLAASRLYPDPSRLAPLPCCPAAPGRRRGRRSGAAQRLDAPPSQQALASTLAARRLPARRGAPPCACRAACGDHSPLASPAAPAGGDGGDAARAAQRAGQPCAVARAGQRHHGCGSARGVAGCTAVGMAACAGGSSIPQLMRHQSNCTWLVSTGTGSRYGC